MTVRLLLNGKKSDQEDIRTAVYLLRNEGHAIEVRPTWESGDFERLVLEPADKNVPPLHVKFKRKILIKL